MYYNIKIYTSVEKLGVDLRVTESGPNHTASKLQSWDWCQGHFNPQMHALSNISPSTAYKVLSVITNSLPRATINYLSA